MPCQNNNSAPTWRLLERESRLELRPLQLRHPADARLVGVGSALAFVGPVPDLLVTAIKRAETASATASQYVLLFRQGVTQQKKTQEV